MTDGPGSKTETEGPRPFTALTPAPTPIAAVIAPGQVWKSLRFVRKIGAGGMGEVWEVENIHVATLKSAVKVILKDKLADEGARARFVREVQILSTLRHPNILHVSDFDVDDAGTTRMVTELLVGDSLEDWVHRAKVNLPVADVVDWMKQTAQALAMTHARGVFHRDIKPANLFRTQDGVVKLLDFGIARSGDTPQLTATQYMAPGTPAYYAPEFLTGGSASGASDIYSLGATFFELLTGAPPYDAPANAENPSIAIMMRHRSDPIPDIKALRKDISADVAALVTRMLAKEPRDRPSAVDVVTACTPATAPTPAPVERALVPPNDRSSGVVVTKETASTGPGVAMVVEPPAPATKKASPVLSVALVLGGGVLVIALSLLFTSVIWPSFPCMDGKDFQGNACHGGWFGDDDDTDSAPSSSAGATDDADSAPSPAAVEGDQPRQQAQPGDARRAMIAALEATSGKPFLPRVRVSEGHALALMETTTGDYDKCVAAGACQEAGKSARCSESFGQASLFPITCVTMVDAKAFCAWVDGRLPEADDIPKVAPSDYPWGYGIPDCSLAHFNGCDDDSEAQPRSPHVVCHAKARVGGVCDLVGNVAEWRADGRKYGGGFADPPAALYVSGWTEPLPALGAAPDIGFRCAFDG